MSHEAVDSWIKKAKEGASRMPVANRAAAMPVMTREEPKSKGRRIMDIAEAIRPWIMKLFEGARDEAGLLLQPARIRGIALNVAQDIVNEHERKN